MVHGKSGRKIWVLRHGLRLDFADEQWALSAEHPSNPPLHPTGLIQAEESAARLAGEGIDWIFSSPFLRTLQTASIVAEKLKKPFSVEKGFSEWLKASEFKHSPLTDVEGYPTREFPQLDARHRSFAQAEYPEGRDALDARVQCCLQGILDAYDGSILIISHASPIDSVFKALVNEEPENFQAMCAVSCFNRESGKWVLTVNRDSSHLTSPDTTSRQFYQDHGLLE